MKKPIKGFLFSILIVMMLIIASEYLGKVNRMDNLKIQNTTAIILKKEIQPEGNYQQYSWVGKTMRSFTVHKVKEFRIFTTIDNKEVHVSVSEADYLKYNINDTIIVEYVVLGFPKKIVATSISKTISTQK